MNDTRKPRHTIFGKLSYHQNIHYKLENKICGSVLTYTLIKYLKVINPLLLDFAAGKPSSITRNEIESISTQLLKMKNQSQNEKLIVKNLLNILTAIQGGDVLIGKYTDLQGKYLEKSKDSDILRNKEKLKEYIESLKKSNLMLLFDFGTAKTTGLKLKPKYEIYIQRHGIPENGVFNVEYMGEIINELEREKCNNH